MTKEGDLVLVTIEDQPAFFARIESITPDVKPEWYQVKMLVLQIPLMVITWILREPYINGEQFTMGGRPITLSKVVAPDETASVAHDDGRQSWPSTREEEAYTQENGNMPAQGGDKVVSLTDRLKKRMP